jgi:two-component system CheB/CheR fusion protein
VVVNSNMQIIQFRGQTGPYLEPAPGNASLNLLKMAREGLLYGLRTALHAARKRGGPARKEGLRVKSNGGFHTVSVEVFPLGSVDQEKHYLVVFHEASGADGRGLPRRREPRTPPARGDRQVARLQQELAASRDYLQSMIQDLEAANEELQSANEEILSSNEELQSTNEELDTAKEELQSINEELNTVNEELHGRNEELSRVNSDLVNLLSNVQLAIVMVSADLRIRRFTPMAERILNLIRGVVGRPIGNIQPSFDCPGLEQTIADVIDTVTVHQRDVQDKQGRWYQLVIRPYKNMMNQIDGAVLALYDIDTTLRQDRPRAVACELAMEVADMVGTAAVVLDKDLRIRQANPAFLRKFRGGDGLLEGRHIMELEDEIWRSKDLVAGLRRSLAEGDGTLSLDIMDRKDGGRPIELRGRCMPGEESGPLLILVMAEGEADGPAHPR